MRTFLRRQMEVTGKRGRMSLGKPVGKVLRQWAQPKVEPGLKVLVLTLGSLRMDGMV